MRNSKRARIQKKKRISRQRGSSDPNVPKRFLVFYNYVLKNESEDGGPDTPLTRELNEYELDVCQQVMEETVGDIKKYVEGYDFAALRIGKVVQLEQPANDKHFVLDFTVTNKSVEEAIALIRVCMEEVYASGYTHFDQSNYREHRSNDQNRYFTTPGQNVDVAQL